MPVEYCGFHLVPVGFFDRNPALDAPTSAETLPLSRPSVTQSGTGPRGARSKTSVGRGGRPGHQEGHELRSDPGSKGLDLGKIVGSCGGRIAELEIREVDTVGRSDGHAVDHRLELSAGTHHGVEVHDRGLAGELGRHLVQLLVVGLEARRRVLGPG